MLARGCVLCSHARSVGLAHAPVISSDQAPVACSPILSADVARIATFLPLIDALSYLCGGKGRPLRACVAACVRACVRGVVRVKGVRHALRRASGSS